MLMKLRNLLVLGALLLAGSASAAIQERQKPALPEPIDAFTDGVTSMYMYNVGAERFFCAGNSWGTQTSIGDEGYRVYFEQFVVDAATGWDGTTVIFKDSCLAKSGAIHTVFFDNVNGGCFVDKGSQANYYWKLQKNADNAYYRLSMAENNPDYQAWQVDAHPNTFWGWDAANGTVVSSFLDPSLDGIHVDWGFCTVAAYDAYKVTIGVYNTAQELKAQIEAAAAEGIDVAAWEAVYNNTAATTEELEAAIAGAKDALAKVEELKVDPLNPVSKTSAITNPSYDANDNAGWSGTTPGFQSYTDAEHYNKTFDSWQLVTGLPNGLYKLTVQGFYRPSTADATGAVFYAANGTDSLTVNVPDINSATTLASKPNNMQSAEQAFVDGHYGVELYFVVVNNQARIGVALPKTTGGTDWVIWDNWGLTYYGNKGEATYTGAVTGLVNAALAKFDGREAEVTVGTIDTYKATLNGLTASDLAGVNAAIATIEEAAAAVQTNIDGWVKYNEEIERGNKVRTDNSYGPSTQMNTMSAYVARTAPAILRAKALSTEELLAEVAKLTELIEEAIRNSLVVDSDVTDMFLVNAKFEDTTDGKNDGRGWEGGWTDVNGPENNKVMELYAGWDSATNPDWDVYQIVKKAPIGLYEVSLNGFYRAGDNADAYAAYEAAIAAGQEPVSHTSVYVNNNSSPFKNIYSEPVKCGELYSTTEIYGPTPWLPVAGDSTGYWYPNGMYDAGVAFSNGMYKSSAHGIVYQEGQDLRLGVKAKGMIKREWAICDNFQMIYRGKQAVYVKPHLEEAIVVGKATLAKGMDKDTKVLVETAVANGEAALSSTEDDVVFDALVALYAANDSVEASADLFDALLDAATEIETAIMQYGDEAGAAALGAAQDLMLAIMDGVQNSTLTKAEAADLLAQKDPTIMALVFGEGPYTDDNPKDLTILLSTPSFEDETGAGSTAGWTGANGATGSYAYEVYEKAFDLYQELTGLKNGTYHLTASAFERQGSSLNDYDTYKVNPDTASTFIYGVSGGVTYQKPVARLASSAILGNALGLEGLATVDTLKDVEVGADSIYYVPNNMATGATFFNDYEAYGCDVWIEVTDGTLRIGMKKDAFVTYDWVMMDNFQLFYHGTESAYKPESIGEVVLGTNANVVKSEIFSISGARMNKLQKGINLVRRTHADGQVTMQKLYVK